VRVELPEPPATVSRWKALNGVLAIPHYFVMIIYGIAALVIVLIAWFAVIITGRWPQGMRDLITRFSAYFLRVWAHVYMVDEKYPSFSLD